MQTALTPYAWTEHKCQTAMRVTNGCTSMSKPINTKTSGTKTNDKPAFSSFLCIKILVLECILFLVMEGFLTDQYDAFYRFLELLSCQYYQYFLLSSSPPLPGSPFYAFLLSLSISQAHSAYRSTATRKASDTCRWRGRWFLHRSLKFGPKLVIIYDLQIL